MKDVKCLWYSNVMALDQFFTTYYNTPRSLKFEVNNLKESNIEIYESYESTVLYKSEFRLEKSLPILVGKSSVLKHNNTVILVNKTLPIKKGSFRNRINRNIKKNKDKEVKFFKKKYPWLRSFKLNCHAF